MTKLWQGKSNKKIEKFTVGNDYLLDKKLLPYDCKASIAHAKMLKKIGVMKEEELELLYFSTGLYISNKFKVSNGNDELLNACRKLAGDVSLHEDS